MRTSTDARTANPAHRGNMTRRLARALGHNLLIVVGLASVLLYGTATETNIEPSKPVAQGSPVALMQANDCWEGSPPADMVGEIPGRVVIRFEGQDVRVAGSQAVGIALDHIFVKPNPRVAQVHGFCR
ncbi:hypothetical protein [uncultured Arthrobacter sp.]|uniref:hypothetical protein n=1 Tax=uncultured Arthrobacter sp. TaxID=114050 RepID=UPI0025CFFEEB|nr:hypothetical protein [uncultured Arthrobacter sp.]